VLLELDDVSVSAGGIPLLQRISLSLGPGELLGVTGPSGCGKTTLLKTVAGLIEPAAGRIRFGGEAPSRIGLPAYRRQAVFVHQRPVLLNDTVRANLERPFRYHSVSGPCPIDRAAEWLLRIGLERDRLDQNARSLSVGQQQRVCLVRALLLEPALVLLDEPTSALENAAASAVENLLQELTRQRGLAALVVAHDRQHPDTWCHRHLDLNPYRAGPDRINTYAASAVAAGKE
jgi:ABC-type iron transport system FetAB ATPase subunit